MAATKKTKTTTPENEPFIQFRRIVVALDESSESLAALEAAARLASVLGRELLGVFVEDENLLKYSQLPLASEYRWGATSGSSVTAELMQAALRVQAERVRRHFLAAARQARVESTFQISRGRIPDELRSRVQTRDLLILGRTGRSPRLRRRLGSTASSFCQEAHRTLMLVRSLEKNPPLLILYENPEQRHQALELAKRIRGSEKVIIRVVEPRRKDQEPAKESAEAPSTSSLRSVLVERGGIIVSRFPEELCEYPFLERFLQEIDAHVILLKENQNSEN